MESESLEWNASTKLRRPMEKWTAQVMPFESSSPMVAPLSICPASQGTESVRSERYNENAAINYADCLFIVHCFRLSNGSQLSAPKVESIIRSGELS